MNRHVVRRVQPIFKIAYLAPFFLGPLLFLMPLFPPSKLFLQGFLKRYLTFLGGCLAWGLFLAFALWAFRTVRDKNQLAVARRQDAAAGRRWPGAHIIDHAWAKRCFDAGKILLLLAGALAVITSIEIFRLDYPRSMLYVLLTALGCSAAEQALAQRNLWWGRLLCRFIWLTLVGQISLFSISLLWSWQQLPVSLGLACMLTAPGLSRVITAKLENSSPALLADRNFAVILRLQPVLLMLGPITIGALCYAGSLEAPYYATSLSLPIAAYLVSLTRNVSVCGTLPNFYTALSEGICFLHVVILFALAIIQHRFPFG